MDTNNNAKGKRIFKEHLRGKGYTLTEDKKNITVFSKNGKKIMVDKKTISPPLNKFQ